MVQMTHARTYNPKTGEWGEITAKKYKQDRERYLDLEAAGEFECHCPDPHCDGVRLQHYNDRLQTYYDPHQRPYRVEIPSYFQRAQGTLAHHPDCEIVRQYGAFQAHARLHGGLSFGNGVFMFNLNIPTMQSEGPVRQSKVHVGPEFARRADDGVPRPAREKRKFSEGMKSLEAFGGMLERAAFDPEYRRTLMFRKGPVTYNIDQLYKETPADLFKEAKKMLREKRGNATAVTIFKPAALPKFWVRGRTGPGTIYGQPDSVKGRDNQHYHVNTVLHVEDRELYARIKEQFHGGYPSFMVYSEKIYIDLDEIARRNEHARATHENTAFHVHVHVSRPEQIVPWTAPGPQREFDFQKPVFDLRTAARRRSGNGSPGVQPA